MCGGAAGEVDDGAGERLVKGGVGVGEACYAGEGAQCGGEGAPK